MNVWINVTISIAITLSVAACSILAFIKFWGKTFVEKRVTESLKEKQHELDIQLEKVKIINERINRVILTLHDEEIVALKKISKSMYLSLLKVSELVHIIRTSNIEIETFMALLERYSPYMDDFEIALAEGIITIDREIGAEVAAFKVLLQDKLNQCKKAYLSGENAALPTLDDMVSISEWQKKAFNLIWKRIETLKKEDTHNDQ